MSRRIGKDVKQKNRDDKQCNILTRLSVNKNIFQLMPMIKAVSNQKLKKRKLTFQLEEKNKRIKVEANPAFGKNYGFIEDTRSGDRIEDYSDSENHTEPKLISAFYGSTSPSSNWQKANSLALTRQTSGPYFYLFTERQPCDTCRRNLVNYSGHNIVNYVEGITYSEDIMRKYISTALSKAKKRDEYKDLDFKGYAFSRKFPCFLYLAYASKGEEWNSERYFSLPSYSPRPVKL